MKILLAMAISVLIFFSAKGHSGTEQKAKLIPPPGLSKIVAQPGADNGESPEGTSPHWMATVQKQLSEQEYFVSRTDKGLQAPNRQLDLRSYFSTEGLVVESRRVSNSVPLLALRYGGLSREGVSNRAVAAVVDHSARDISHQDNQVTLTHNDGIEEWYINSYKGLEHGFNVHQRLPGQGRLQLNINVPVGTVQQNGDDIKVRLADGRQIDAQKLVVVDARQQRLASQMVRLSGGQIQLQINDASARYPLVIASLVINAPVTTVEGGQDNAKLGFSVAGAGDVNNDNYDDVIVGAPFYDNGPNDEGAAFVYHGSASGISTVIVSQLESDQGGSRFGDSVNGAGDVNNDGYADVIVGASLYIDGPGQGAAFIYHGSNTGISTTATSQLQNDQANVEFGIRVAGVGDVNGDNYDDVIVGLPYYDGVGDNSGIASIYYGSAAGVDTTVDHQWHGEQAGDQLGFSVAGAGDVNGDNYVDVVVGALAYGSSAEGAAFVYHGSDSGLSATATSTLAGTQAAAQFGYSVAGAGDINADGYDDVVVGARHHNGANGAKTGAAFVYHGSSSGLSSTATSYWEGKNLGDEFGGSVAGVGDVNKDGYADVIVGLSKWSGGQGAVVVFEGCSTGFSVNWDWVKLGGQSGSEYGISVAGAGDVNNDGYADVMSGAHLGSNGNTNEGAAYVYHGSAGTSCSTGHRPLFDDADNTITLALDEDAAAVSITDGNSGMAVTDGDIGNTLSWTLGSITPNKGVVTISGTSDSEANGGHLPSGVYTYTPNIDANGEDSFSVVVDDGNGGSDTLAVNVSINDIADISSVALPTDGNYNLGAALDFVVSFDESVTVTGIPSIALEIGGVSKTATYVSAAPANTMTFRYTIENGLNDSDGIRVTNTIALNGGTIVDTDGDGSGADLTNISFASSAAILVDSQGPVLEVVNEIFTFYDLMLPVSVPVSYGLLINDTGDGPLTVAILQGPETGSITLNSNGSFEYNYIPDYSDPMWEPFIGYWETFTYTVTDANGATAVGTATVIVELGFPPQPNMAPSVVADNYSVESGALITIDAGTGVLNNDSDPEGSPLTAQLVNNVAHGVLSLGSDGAFTYTHDGSDTTTDSFSYKAFDGANYSTVVTVTFTVSLPYIAPQGVSDSYTGYQGNVIKFNAAQGVLSNDSGTGPLTASLVDTGFSLDVVVLNADGSFYVVPFSTSTSEVVFNYTATDGNNASFPTTVTVTILPGDSPLPDDPMPPEYIAPAAVADSYLVPENTSIYSINSANGVLKNDSGAGVLYATIVEHTLHGALHLNSDGSFTYLSLNMGSVSFDSDLFTYRITDGETYSETVTVTLNIVQPNSAPTISGISATVLQQNLLYDFLPSALDTDNGDILTFSITNKPGWATFESTTGQLSGTPGIDDVGITTGIVITVSDSILTASLPSFDLTVSNTPAITAATFDATTGVLVVTGSDFIALAGTDNDVDTSLLTITGEGGASYSLANTTDVDIVDATSFTVTLNAVDKTHVDGLLNKSGTESDSSSVYNLAAAEDWMSGVVAEIKESLQA
ncbi:MAG: FG-GAP repeat protein [Algicola sp.]|nr:FG-GAP repeat protein [Algicola sp.]